MLVLYSYLHSRFDGPFPAGNPDICVARAGAVHQLEKQEKIWLMEDIEMEIDTPTGLHNISQRMSSLCRACHETNNGRSKKI
jgi:hypothetical protein